ncbi:MAG: hypothetical protein ACT4PP_16235 [Sporichthyaceae bacterium]
MPNLGGHGGLTPARKTRLLASAGLALAAVAAYTFVLSPRSDAVEAVKVETTASQGANAALRSQIATRTAQKRQLPRMRTISAALDDRFPPTAEQAKFFKMITAAAGQAGIAPQSLTNLSVDPPAALAGAGGSSAQLPGVAGAPTDIASQRISLNVSAPAAQIRALVANLEKLPRAFAVTSMSLVNAAPAPPALVPVPGAVAVPAPPAGPPRQTVTIVGEMYVMPKLVDPTKAAR